MGNAAVYEGEYPSPVPVEPDVVAPREIRSTDITKATVPIGLVVVMVIAISGFGIAQAVSLSSLRSDVRDIRTLLDSQKELIDLKFQLMRAEMEKGELRKALLDSLKPEREK